MGADAIHPGFGFLSENSEFVRKCQENGITFIGPDADVIDKMGNKSHARKTMMDAGVPVVPGTKEPVYDAETGKKLAEEIGYPVMIKASSGGGGKGMRVAANEDEFEFQFNMAQRESANAFGDDTMYIERFVENPRHVEIQIMADSHGNVVALGERDCSVQRNHQKLIEESPSPAIDDATRKKMNEYAVLAAKTVGYTNAGKSTLLNRLTDAGVLSEDKLFATLDPTTRALTLPNKEKVLMTDTVGFIRKLPHNLIEAFKSTLEEAKYADMIIHVVDCSNDDYERHMATVYETLKQLDVGDKPIITLFNKCDKYGELPILKDSKADYVENISARTGVGIDEFLEDVQDIILKSRIRIERVFPYSDAGKIQLIREYGQLESEEYTQEGISVKGYVPAWVGGKL